MATTNTIRKMTLSIFLSVAALAAGPASSALQFHIPYDQFGRFNNVGTARYSYELSDAAGLREKVAKGIYPNTLRRERPVLSKAEMKRKLDVWMIPPNECVDFWSDFDPSWGKSMRINAGTRQYDFAVCLERAGRFNDAIDAYYATAVHFPSDPTPDQNWPGYWPAYVGIKAMDAIYHLTRTHPELGLRYIGADFEVDNGFDKSIDNDILRIWPGRIVTVAPQDVVPTSTDLAASQVPLRIGSQGSTSALQRYKNSHWALTVDGKPFTIKGVVYAGKAHTALENVPWLDANANGNRDNGEPQTDDFALMAMMGANTVLIDAANADPDTLNNIYERHGLRFIISDDLESPYSDAWPKQKADFTDERAREMLLVTYRQRALKFKDAPYLLAWSFGWEDPAGSLKRDDLDRRRAYYQFAADAIREVKGADGRHPVIFTTNDVLHLDIIATTVKNADILGINTFRGFHGLGRDLWRTLKQTWDKPVLITSYGMPAHALTAAAGAPETLQAMYHQRAWEDIMYQSAGNGGTGIALGGCVFEWTDAWWRQFPRRQKSAQQHDFISTLQAPFGDGRDYPEWYGILAQDAQGDSRVPRKSFWTYLKLWK
ncbi:MAG: hypothetical protein AABZ44_01335 [Elusimicrobiota bacterium]